MKSKYYSSKSIFCSSFCQFRGDECSNAVCPIVALKQKEETRDKE